MKKLLVFYFLLSALSANAMVTMPSGAKIRAGYIDGISVRSDINEVTVLIVCNKEKALIKYANDNFKEGLNMSSAIGRFYSVSMSRAISRDQISVDEYQMVSKQDALSGEVVCAQ